MPTDVVQYILARIQLVHHIGRAAPTCRVISVAARNARKVRPFSRKVVTLAGHGFGVNCVAAAPDGRYVIGSEDSIITVWHDGACVRTLQAHPPNHPYAMIAMEVAVLPGGARFVSGSVSPLGYTAKLWTLDGVLERTFRVGSHVHCVAALPDGVHFVAGLGHPSCEVRLYHVDGTLVHTFEGHDHLVLAVAVTPDGQHIVSGSRDKLLKVWNVASRSHVSTCNQHAGGVYAVAAMPDGKRILSGSYKTVGVPFAGAHEALGGDAPHLDELVK